MKKPCKYSVSQGDLVTTGLTRESSAVFISTVGRLSSVQKQGLKIFKETLEAAGESFPMRLLKDKFADIRMAQHADEAEFIFNGEVIMGYMSKGASDIFELLPRLDGVLTDRAREILCKALVKTSAVDDYAATLGVFYSIRTILDDAAEFGIDGVRFVIMAEVREVGMDRVVDLLIYNADGIADINSISRILPDRVLFSMEVKWYKATSSIARNETQMTLDIVRSVRRGNNMSDVFWMVPKNYPMAKVDDMISFVKLNIDDILSVNFPGKSAAETLAIKTEVIERLEYFVFREADEIRTFMVQ